MTPLVEELHHRRDTADTTFGWSREPCDLFEDWHVGPEAAARRHAIPRMFLGSQVATLPDDRHRFVNRTDWPHPPGELAREYLRTCMAAIRPHVKPRSMLGRGRIPFRQPALEHLLTPPAFHFDPPRERGGRWVLVDLVSAYWQILQAATMDMFWRPDGDELRWLVGRVEFLRSDEQTNKHIGRAIYGSMRARDLKVLRYGVPKILLPRGPLLSPDAIGYLIWTMHAIALDAVTLFGAASWQADAAILRPEQSGPFLEFLRDEWHVEAVVKCSGFGYLWSLGSWKIGTEERGITRTDQGPLSNLLVLSPRLRRRIADVRESLLRRQQDPADWPADDLLSGNPPPLDPRDHSTNGPDL